MQRTVSILAGLIIVVGAVFIGQGLGLLRGSSFMVDDRRWAIIGAVMVAIGIVIAWRANAQRRRSG
jgi:hypothetical protein